MTGLHLSESALRRIAAEHDAGPAMRLMAHALLRADQDGVADFAPFELRGLLASGQSDDAMRRASGTVSRVLGHLHRWRWIHFSSPARIRLNLSVVGLTEAGLLAA